MTETQDRTVSPGKDMDRAEPTVQAKEPFDAFYARERRAMIALAYATLKSPSLAEDITQEAFAAAYRDWERVGHLDKPATWVRRVVINKSVSTIRRRVSAQRMLARLKGDSSHVELPPLSAESEHVWVEVRKLPKRQREAVALRYVDQLSLVEIADVLGCSKDTVNTHLVRARSTLARRLRTQEEI